MGKQIIMNVPATLEEQLSFINGMIDDTLKDSFAESVDNMMQYESEQDFLEVKQRLLFLLYSVKATLEACNRKQTWWDKIKSIVS